MKYCFGIIGMLAGVVIGYAIFACTDNLDLSRSISKFESREGGGVLTNPLLECMGVDQNESVTQLNISKYKLNEYINRIENKGDVMSVYVRDLNNGPWLGINEKEEFVGASLLKVPVLISYMKMDQDSPGVLDKKIKYVEEMDPSVQYFASDKEIKIGEEYKTYELLDSMITYSDNNAAALLVKSLSDKQINNTFEAIGLSSPIYSNVYSVTPKDYAGFFRILYNASYLNKEYSEKALSYLTHTKFDRGLTKYLPKQITVAHKYGEREDKNLKQLHDCGIVYYPNHPYLICIMAKGSDIDRLAENIAQVSKFVYDQVKEIN